MSTIKKRVEKLEAASKQKIMHITLIKDLYKPLWFRFVETEEGKKKEYFTEAEAIKAFSGYDVKWVDNTETRRKRIERANKVMGVKND